MGGMVQAYNPTYMEGGDLENHGLRPAQAKSSQDSISTNGWMSWYTCVILGTLESTNRKITD
jgi:hypothetical protein